MLALSDIEKARQRLGVKPSTLSTEAGLHASTYGNALKGKFDLTQKSLEKLAAALVTIEERGRALRERVEQIGAGPERARA